MPIDTGEVRRLNAVEAKRRDLRVRLSRIRGQLDASAAASRFFARINQDTQIQRDQAETELRALEDSGESGITDGWGEFTSIDKLAKAEREAGAAAAYNWLVLNPTGDATTFTETVASGMAAHSTAQGRSQPLQRAPVLVAAWIAAAFAARTIPAADWPSFRAHLLTAVDLASALDSMG